MKAFFNRLAGKDKDKDHSSSLPKEKFPPLRQWPPEETPRPTSVTPSVASTAFKPLPELAPSQIASQLNSRPLPPIDQASSQDSSRSTPPTPAPQSVKSEEAPEPDLTTLRVSVSRKNTKDSSKEPSNSTTASSNVEKKVAFISPAPTPTPNALDRIQPEPPQAPLKTPVSKFQATHGKEPRGPPPASSSRTDVSNSAQKSTSTKATSTRTASPYGQKSFDVGSSPSLRSGTPYSSMTQNTSGSRILAASSWSEVTEGDLVSNLGSRERTRQEVLFEIIQSEERCVAYPIRFSAYTYPLHAVMFKNSSSSRTPSSTLCFIHTPPQRRQQPTHPPPTSSTITTGPKVPWNPPTTFHPLPPVSCRQHLAWPRLMASPHGASYPITTWMRSPLSPMKTRATIDTES